MAFVIGNNGADKEHPPIGTTRALCIGIYDIGWQEGYQGKPPEKKVLYLWEVDARLEGGEHKGKRHLVSKSYKQSMHEKSSHAQMLEGWLGKKFSDDERVAEAGAVQVLHVEVDAAAFAFGTQGEGEPGVVVVDGEAHVTIARMPITNTTGNQRMQAVSMPRVNPRSYSLMSAPSPVLAPRPASRACRVPRAG